MRRAREIRRVLQDLLNNDVLIGYHLSIRHGQWVTVWGENGYPVRLCLAAARVYADRLEDMAWGLL